MFLARVQGRLVATAKDPGIAGKKLLVVEPLKVDYDDPAAAARPDGEPRPEAGGSFAPTGRAIVALDMIGAGEGQLVLIVQGSSARMAQGCANCPTDAAVIGIVDEAYVLGSKLH